MARFLGEVSGRTSVPYTDATVNTACSNLCSYVNTVCSNINSAKLSCSGGNGSQLTNIVTSISAGSGLSVDQSTGVVTISASGGSGASILYNCACCWNGSATIPSSTRGNFTHYEIIGSTQYHIYYCSLAAFCFAPWPGCSQSNYATWCCAHCSCGWVGDAKCFNGSYLYSCAGAISAPFGCSSSCFTACSNYGFQYLIRLSPENPCTGNYRGFQYCFVTSKNGSTPCCIGVRNSGYAYPCCGMHPACLRGVCFSTPSGSIPFSCGSSVTILGYGRIV